MGEHNLKVVQEFSYSGAKLTSNNDEETEIQKRIPRLSMHVRLQRLRWSGHVQRMHAGRVPRRNLEGKPGGKRSVGKPRAGWVDGVNVDTKNILGLRTRVERVWGRRIEETRARFEL
ncbi:uncharacterized protein LOC126857791 [Cataglyphis hispanica]|uniref:uncharacterized protein LOC126857791 n=1 Tax=Cataglyphis hispanica TaxID=1086592 RepID=UPI00218047ED|nr:uncharacterized protein LOC126857791 [Cataglyphis hispanica]